MFFSYDKSANSIFSHGLSAKQTSIHKQLRTNSLANGGRKANKRSGGIVDAI
jgi:hypothetical protein